MSLLMKFLSLNFIFLFHFFFASSLYSVEFDCVKQADSSDQVLHCKSKTNYYADVVHFYIPLNHYSSEPSLGTSLYVHFHGHNLKNYNHFSKIFGDYGTYLLESRSNAILVIPESQGKCETYDHFFSDEKRTLNFFSGIKNSIQELIGDNVHSLVLSGHSGSYRSLNQILKYKNIFKEVRAVGLFDATYGDIGQIEKWIIQNKIENNNVILYNSFVTGKKATAEKGSLLLENHLKKLNSENIFSVPIKGEGETLDQHFFILRNGGLKYFWEKTSIYNL